MRILWHMPTLSVNSCGLSNRAMRYAESLVRAGHVVSFVVPDDKTDMVGEPVPGVSLQKPDVARRRPLHWSLQGWERRRAARAIVGCFDVPHDLFISCQPEVVCAYAEKSEEKPVVFICGGSTLLHDDADAEAIGKKSPLRRIPYTIDRRIKHANEHRAFEMADAVVFNSHHTRERVIRSFRMAPEKGVTIHGGVEPTRFRAPSPGQRAAARAQLAIEAGEVVLAWTGRLSPEKNLPLLIRALAQCRSSVDRFYLVGEGHLREKLISLVAAKGLDDVIYFEGSQTDVRPYLHAADIFVFPSRSESFGQSLIEAMACGLPCVALGGGSSGAFNASEEILGGDEFGVIVRSNDPAALAEAIDRLVADEPRRRMLGSSAARRAALHFSWLEAGRQLNDLLGNRFGHDGSAGDSRTDSRIPGEAVALSMR